MYVFAAVSYTHLDVYKRQILDGAKVTFGNNVFIAPNVVFTTAGHAIDREQRAKGLEIALPITVGDDVWIGTNVSVLPEVSIGSNTIIAVSYTHLDVYKRQVSGCHWT